MLNTIKDADNMAPYQRYLWYERFLEWMNTDEAISEMTLCGMSIDFQHSLRDHAVSDLERLRHYLQGSIPMPLHDWILLVQAKCDGFGGISAQQDFPPNTAAQ